MIQARLLDGKMMNANCKNISVNLQIVETPEEALNKENRGDKENDIHLLMMKSKYMYVALALPHHLLREMKEGGREKEGIQGHLLPDNCQ